MPTKKERQRKLELENFFNSIESSKLVRRCKLIPPNDDLSHGVYRGITLTDEQGNVGKHPKLGGDIAKRSLNKMRYALDLKKKYKDVWGLRGKAKIIAINEDLSVSTIQKYFKDYP